MRRLPAKRLAALGATVIVLGGGAGFYAATNADPVAYRTVAVGTGDVEELLATSGTVDSASRAEATAQLTGTVAAVKVAEGDKVAPGQVVAVLDRTGLKATLVEARSTLAEARARLVEDRQAQAAAVTASTASETRADTDNAAPSSQPSSQPSAANTDQASTGTKPDQAAAAAETAKLKKLLAQLAAQQDAVTSAASAASAALTAAHDALETQTTLCTEEETVSAACTQALQDVQTAQGAAAEAQDALQAAISTLAGTVSAAASNVTQSASSSTGSSQSTSTSGQSPSSPSSQSSQSGPAASPGQSATTDSDATGTESAAPAGSQGSAGTVTAAQLAQDQAGIDEARAAVLRAEQELAAAVVRAPRAGRVVALSAANGSEVDAGDSVAVIFSGKALAVEVSLSEEEVSRVAAGQRATVRAPGASTASEGEVTAVGSVSTSTSGAATFPATILLDHIDGALPSGSSVRVEIVTGSVDDVVRVPVSALSRTTTGGTVQVLRAGEPQRRRVSVGSSGERWVEITDGLNPGERVVLADLDAEITGAATSLQSDRGTSGPPGGFRGAQPPTGSGTRSR
ncbi:efflux RND transporter periplasmic adaptor subunit [Nocardioides sp. Bht2]|uniref:efflux RND transporter periplasmic adaptor subunit n=1 Tax=Nocardioides sp. Bht2 TaxID=3392297 RepID=UPI0039B4215C